MKLELTCPYCDHITDCRWDPDDPGSHEFEQVCAGGCRDVYVVCVRYSMEIECKGLDD